MPNNISYPPGCSDIPGNNETHYQLCPHNEDNVDAADDAECICNRLHEEDRQDAEARRQEFLEHIKDMHS